MPTHPKDGLAILAFPALADWERWLETEAEQSAGVWLKIAKKGADSPTVTYAEALGAALCFGWIDGQRAAHDASHWLQRFTPRNPRSRWSQLNVERAQELIEQGRMRPAGLRQVEAARSDGRWEAAYESQSRATVPPDFGRELDRSPKARALFETLNGANRYAFIYRINSAKRPETRAARIARFVEMLEQGRTFY